MVKGMRFCDSVIVDTAGRHQLDEELVDELEEIAEITQADQRWLVIDAMLDRLQVQ